MCVCVQCALLLCFESEDSWAARELRARLQLAGDAWRRQLRPLLEAGLLLAQVRGGRLGGGARAAGGGIIPSAERCPLPYLGLLRGSPNGLIPRHLHQLRPRLLDQVNIDGKKMRAILLIQNTVATG